MMDTKARPRAGVFVSASQNCFSSPACFSTPLAVCRDLMLLSTGKLRLVTGLYQIS